MASMCPWGQGTQDLHPGLGLHRGLALQGRLQVLDGMLGQVGDVAQGLVLDLAVLAVGAAYQGGLELDLDAGLVGPAGGVDGYVHGLGALFHVNKFNP